MRNRPDQSIQRSVNELLTAVTRLVSSVTAPARAGASPSADLATRGADVRARLRSAVKAHWDAMTPKERAARVRRMLAGRGLKPRPKSARRPQSPRDAAKSARLRSALKAHWDSMSPAEHAARVKRMLAGRGLAPKRPA